MSAEAWPLQWPDGWPRVKGRGRPPYTVTGDRAREDLLWALKKLGATNVVISTNIPVRRDGQYYASESARRVNDPGVAVYFTRFTIGKTPQQQVIACDKWDRVDGNIRAIGLAIEGMLAIQRSGASEFLDRAFTGFKALPASIDGKRWWHILECQPDAPIEDIRSKYRQLAALHHPDKGGDVSMMTAINRAWEQAQQGPRP